ncbi:MAG: hypothetical protein M1834_003439 [Cirrosporium novae-zelandiae]|nr:MAG: hypothetical protein M1834_003439 [Cirrosporium novae-zelandiae]
MLCAISGEAPQNPVASSKSGNVFEKRLVEAYITEHGTDPVTGEDLSIDDLIDLKPSRIIHPRPPTLTSIPSLLRTFQDEWDSLALETYDLKRQLAQTRQELSTALYLHDAAVRVIARLTKERDEARGALSNINIASTDTHVPRNGDAMQIDGHGLPEEVITKINKTQEKLSKGRRKRPVPEGWATTNLIQTYDLVEKIESVCPGCKSLCFDESSNLILMGGSAGMVEVFSLSQREVIQKLKVEGDSVNDAIWVGKKVIIGTSAGTVKIFEDGNPIAEFHSHAGPTMALAQHPCRDIIASAGIDKSYVLYDIVSSKALTQVYTSSELTTMKFHPDGHLLALGGVDGQIKIFDVGSGTNAANFQMAGHIQTLSFSENGTWLAAAVKGESNVSIWDLRKAEKTKILDIGNGVEQIEWDYSGQFLAVAGPSGLVVKWYSKVSKEWLEPLRTGVPSVALKWGLKARSLVSMDNNGSLSILASKE